jgi:uncharacterized membrane protein YebE (DUF533 family)
MTYTKTLEKNPVLTKLSAADKKTYIETLVHLARLDGHFDDDEVACIKDLAQAYEATLSDELTAVYDENILLEKLSSIHNRPAALELIKDMCFLGHADDNLSPEEVLFIGHAGQALGIDIKKIEEISDWVIDLMIWREKGHLILEH